MPKATRTILGVLALALLGACGDRDLTAPDVSAPHRDELSCGYLGSNNCPERTPQSVVADVKKPKTPLSPPPTHPMPR